MAGQLKALVKEGLLLLLELATYVLFVALLPLVLAAALVCGVVDFGRTKVGRRAGGR